MPEPPKLFIYEELSFTVGHDTIVGSSTENNHAVIFEDNGETGYFYAVSRNPDLTILDALHIYNIADIIDKDKLSTLKFLWTEDLNKDFLSINNYHYAVFDFQNRAGYCRTGFPPPKRDWTLISERKLTDALIVAFSNNASNPHQTP